MMKVPKVGVRKRGHIVLAGVALAGFLTYAMVIPYMMIATIKGDGHESSAKVKVRREGWFAGGVGSRRMLGHPEQLQQQQLQHQQQKLGPTWQKFWGSEWEEGMKAIQQLKHTIDVLRYQRLTKDVEDQATAGLDIALTEHLRRLSNATKLEEAQAWLRKEVTDAVFDKINQLQHPQNCTEARKLLCDLNKACGFGCQVHHVVHCLAHAIALNMTMVLRTYPSNYITQPNGWNDQLQPAGSCTEDDMANKNPPMLRFSGTERQTTQQEATMQIIDSGPTVFDPPAVPQDVLEVVQLFNARPEIWWTGVLSAYVLRPSAGSIQRQAEFKAAQSWMSPIVGVHVRRTDKLQVEAKLHQAEEYMRHVERYCDMELPSGWQAQAKKQYDENAATIAEERKAGTARTRYSNCSVYLATDDEAVAYEIRDKYKHIHIITNNLALKTSDTAKRFSTDGLVGILDDVTYLAETDLLVGTLSSQVSRLAYEVNQVNHTSKMSDRAFSYHSVDSMWYYGGQMEYLKCAASDFTDLGSVTVHHGTRLACPIINEFDRASGLMHCFVEATRMSVNLPPASVVDCVPGDGKDDWNMLPEHMRRPVPTPQVPATAVTAQTTASAAANKVPTA